MCNSALLAAIHDPINHTELYGEKNHNYLLQTYKQKAGAK